MQFNNVICKYVIQEHFNMQKDNEILNKTCKRYNNKNRITLSNTIRHAPCVSKFKLHFTPQKDFAKRFAKDYAKPLQNILQNISANRVWAGIRHPQSIPHQTVALSFLSLTLC